MKSVKQVAFWAVAALLLCSCKAEPAWKSHAFVSHDMSQSANDAELPSDLWNKIESLLKEGQSEAKQDAKSDTKSEGASAKALTLPSEFVPLKVYLIEKNRGILKSGNTELLYGPGGGELDFKNFLEPLKGSFRLAVEFLPGVDATQRRVFFLSNGIKRKVGTETLGAGCDVYFDVTSSFSRVMKGEGFLLNTTDHRHVSAMAGTLFFAAVHDGKLHLAQLSIRDSRFKSLHCQRTARIN